MGEEILLSIIIPAFNAEKSIKRCLDSLLNQTYNKDYEIIIIDDGSIDKTQSICLEYKRNICNIKYYRQANSGVSAARNFGIFVAKGKYCTFVDSDDFVKEDYVDSILNSIAKNENTDLVLFDYYIEKSSGYECIDIPINSMDEIIEYAVKQRINAPWNKVFCKNIIKENSILFPVDMKTSEDGLFLLKYLSYCNRYVKIDKYLYVYCINSNGAVANPKLSYIKDQNIFNNEIFTFVEGSVNLTNKISMTKEDVMVERIFSLISNLIRNGEKIKEIDRKMKNNFSFKKIIFNTLSLKNKVKLIILKLRLYHLTLLSKERRT